MLSFKANIAMQVNGNNILDKKIIGFANNDLQYENSIIAIISHCSPKTNSVGYLKEF